MDSQRRMSPVDDSPHLSPRYSPGETPSGAKASSSPSSRPRAVSSVSQHDKHEVSSVIPPYQSQSSSSKKQGSQYSLDQNALAFSEGLGARSGISIISSQPVKHAESSGLSEKALVVPKKDIAIGIGEDGARDARREKCYTIDHPSIMTMSRKKIELRRLQSSLGNVSKI